MKPIEKKSSQVNLLVQILESVRLITGILGNTAEGDLRKEVQLAAGGAAFSGNIAVHSFFGVIAEAMEAAAWNIDSIPNMRKATGTAMVAIGGYIDSLVRPGARFIAPAHLPKYLVALTECTGIKARSASAFFFPWAADFASEIVLPSDDFPAVAKSTRIKYQGGLLGVIKAPSAEHYAKMKEALGILEKAGSGGVAEYMRLAADVVDSIQRHGNPISKPELQCLQVIDSAIKGMSERNFAIQPIVISSLMMAAARGGQPSSTRYDTSKLIPVDTNAIKQRNGAGLIAAITPAISDILGAAESGVDFSHAQNRIAAVMPAVSKSPDCPVKTVMMAANTAVDACKRDVDGAIESFAFAMVAADMMVNERDGFACGDADSLAASVTAYADGSIKDIPMIHDASGVLISCMRQDLGVIEESIKAASAGEVTKAEAEKAIRKAVNGIAGGAYMLGANQASRAVGGSVEQLVGAVHSGNTTDHVINLIARLSFFLDESPYSVAAADALFTSEHLSDGPPDDDGGGGPDIDEELLSVYREEVGMILAQADQRVETLAEGRGLVDVRRDFHTLKGSANMVGLTQVGEAAWVMEDHLNRIIQTGGDIQDSLIGAIILAYDQFKKVETELSAGRYASAVIDKQVIANALNGETAPKKAEGQGRGDVLPEDSASTDTEVPQDLVDLFIEEAASLGDIIRRGVDSISAGGQVEHEVMRAFHTLSSVSGSIGFDALHYVCHDVERWLVTQMGLPLSTPAISAFSAISDMVMKSLPDPATFSLEDMSRALELIVALENAPAKLVGPVVAEKPGHTRDQLAACAEAESDGIDPEIMEIFLVELPQHWSDIHAAMDALTGGAPVDDELRPIKRAIHTMKGGARMAGAMKAGAVFHAIESWLDEVSDQAALVSALPEWLAYAELVTDLYVPLASTDSVPEFITEKPGGAKTEKPKPKSKVGHEAAIDRIISASGESAILVSQLRKSIEEPVAMLDAMDHSISKVISMIREIEMQAEIRMSAGHESGRHSFDALQMDRFTRTQEIARAIAEVGGDISSIRHAIRRSMKSALHTVSKQEIGTREIMDLASGMRMMAVSSLASRLRKIVQQACKDSGKSASLKFSGDASLDRVVMDRIVIALEHILRNAIAHGIEDESVRKASGKPQEGLITVSVAHDGSDVLLEVMDDGAGIDRDAVAKKAKALGLYHEEGDDVINMIFAPGFSTSSEVTILSGRGAGMDVVRNEIFDLGGRVGVSTEVGKGTTFSIRVPPAVSTVSAIPVSVNGAVYAIPASMIERIVRTSDIGIDGVAANDDKIEVNGASHRIVNLSSTPKRVHGQLILMKDARVGVFAQHIERGQSFVMRGLGPQSASMPGVIGGAITADGSAAMIIDPVQIARAEAGMSSTIDSARSQVRKILVVDDALTVRKATERFLLREGCSVETAVDGLDALEKLNTMERLPDVILLDIEMPRMDGFELLRAIKMKPDTAEIPVIMISSRDIEKHRDFALGIGAGMYFGKPYKEHELMAAIANISGAELAQEAA